ncbi:urokinase plasminogen activator surface receptor [Ictalurus punctatus]|uniref:Urokinase plasminogen activator surface receptor n=1 Tax=Ictalurus punctatus TaxID=7998 RepID=A0A2D0SGI3_ICTPU|nr:urokinase plasminogen activator surface receptor [Ictalurus punctatus]
MRTQVTLLLICMISSGALSLQCYPPIYNDTVYRYQGTECTNSCARTTTSVDIYIIGGAAGLALISEDDIMFCGSPEQCVNSSMNIGMVKIANNTQCCRTALCNNKALPAMPQQPTNGKRCYSCNDNDCSRQLRCEGAEDRCITATVTQGVNVMTLKGCTTKNNCNITLLNSHGLIITDVECCEGNLCNDAENFMLSFLLMFVPLLSTVLFY